MPVNPPDSNHDGVPDYLDISSLPIELASFTGFADDGGAASLEWITASEENAAGFSVEHAPPTEGFREAAYIAASGFRQSEQTYHHRVDNLSPGMHQFRLLMIDLDGTSSYSPVVEVVVELKNSVEITSAYPNPFNRSCQLAVTAASDQDVSIDIVDLLGREVKRITGRAMAMVPWRVTVDGSDLPAGSYLLKISGENFVRSSSITVVR
jgi:hypothetical protein